MNDRQPPRIGYVHGRQSQPDNMECGPVLRVKSAPPQLRRESLDQYANWRAA